MNPLYTTDTSYLQNHHVTLDSISLAVTTTRTGQIYSRTEGLQQPPHVFQ